MTVLKPTKVIFRKWTGETLQSKILGETKKSLNKLTMTIEYPINCPESERTL